MTVNFSFSQANEKLLTDAYLSNAAITKENTKCYITEAHGITDLSSFKNLLYKKFCSEQQLCDSIHIDEMCMYATQLPENFKWDADAPIFQSKEYKNVRFIDNEKAIKHIRNSKHVFCISQPAFSNSSEYALVYREHYTSLGRKHLLSYSSYVELFKRVNGRWQKLDRCMIAISSN